MGAREHCIKGRFERIVKDKRESIMYDINKIITNRNNGACVKSTIPENKNNKNNSKIAEELAIKIISGDAQASNEFVRLNYSWLLFIIRRKFFKSNNHEDILQDSFILVLNKLQQGQVHNPKTILAYLRTTAINIGFEYLRKDKKFTSAVDQEMLGIIEGSEINILSQLIWDDKIKYVQLVMDELRKQRDKDILMDFYFNDLDKPTICKKLELTSDHFDKVLFRAKQRLKLLIEQKDSDNTPENKIHVVKDKVAKNNIIHIIQFYLYRMFRLNKEMV